METDDSKDFDFFLNFSIIYNFTKKNGNNEIIENLNQLSKININNWKLNYNKGRVEIFHSFPELKPHLSLIKENRFEIYANEDCIKINFPSEDFFHIAGPRGITRIANFPEKNAAKPCRLNELIDLQNNLNLIFLSQSGLCPNSIFDFISVRFETNKLENFNFKKMQKSISSETFKYDIGRIEINGEHDKIEFNLTFLDNTMMGILTFYDIFSLTTPIEEILEEVKKTFQLITDDLKNE